jgi:COP9 signalosome complex subunit 5
MSIKNSSSQEMKKKFENVNKIESLDGDELFKWDSEKYQAFLATKPWTKDPNYFKKVKISAIALLKMVVHARSGGTIEVMGLIMGKVEGDTMIVTDSFALPVEGTETRVNAQNEGYEYMVEYLTQIREVGKQENALGWYHSHPGYGCWLSGIDVSTQMLNQQFQEPWLAIVIDPVRTISSGKVELGAFRTYPEGYKPDDAPLSEYQSIPISKIEDFGVHCKQYYSLEVTYFKSSLDSQLLDLLWNKYWVNTLSSNALLTNRNYTAGQISDLTEKLEQVEVQLLHSGKMGGYFAPEKKKEESQLSKLTKDSSKVAMEQVTAVMTQVMKDNLFNLKRNIG